MSLSRLRAEWAPDITRDLLTGTAVALALIPEAIAFSIIAGVDPKFGLYASFSIAVITAIAGGRPAMISTATAAMSVVLVILVRDHGIGYMLAATVLTGVIQFVAGLLRLGDLMRFVSRSVIAGFVNALAILIFLAQMHELIGRGMPTHVMVAASLAITYLLPRLTKAIPSPLVAIIAMTARLDARPRPGRAGRRDPERALLRPEGLALLRRGLGYQAGIRTYRVTGQIFFATAEAFHAGFDFREEPAQVVIDVHAAHFWDLTAANALDRVVPKFRHHGVPVEIVGMNEASRTLVDRLGLHDKPGAVPTSGH